MISGKVNIPTLSSSSHPSSRAAAHPPRRSYRCSPPLREERPMEFPIHPVTLGAFISISPPSLRRGARPRLFAPLGSERQGHGSVPAHRLLTDRILRTITSVN